MRNLSIGLVFILGLNSASAQTLADFARQERARRAAMEASKPAADKSPAPTTTEVQPPAPARNTAGFEDCRRDINCLMTALTNGKSAFVRESVSLDGKLEYSYYEEIGGFKGKTVVFYRRVDETRAKYSEKAVQEELKNGMTRAQIAEEERLMTESLAMGEKYPDFTCTFEVPNLAAALKEWMKGSLTMMSGYQFVSGAETCTGPLVEGITFKK